jgi:hypothetical protein
MAVADEKQQIIAVGIGPPANDETFIVKQLGPRGKLYFDPTERKHRRGKFPAPAVSTSGE